MGLSTPEEDSLQWTDCMVPGQSEWNSLSEANDQTFHSGCGEKKASDPFNSTDNSPLLRIKQENNIQNQLSLKIKN